MLLHFIIQVLAAAVGGPRAWLSDSKDDLGVDDIDEEDIDRLAFYPALVPIHEPFFLQIEPPPKWRLFFESMLCRPRLSFYHRPMETEQKGMMLFVNGQWQLKWRGIEGGRTGMRIGCKGG